MPEASGEETLQSDWATLGQLIKARVLEFVREPAAVFWVYVFPLLMMVALGVAFRQQPPPVVSVGVAASGDAARVQEQLQGLDGFDVLELTDDEISRALQTGKVDVVVGVISEASKTRYRYEYDPTRTGSLAARNALDDALQRAAGRADAVTVEDLERKEPGGRYIDFLIPGLLGMGLLGGGLWGVGYAIVDLRIRKLLKRYLATPMKRHYFLAAMMVSRLIFMFPEVVLLLVFARIFFGVTNQGSPLLVVLLILLGAMQFSGIGLLIACRAQTLETISGLMNLVMLPMWIGSGIFFSVERFPDAMQNVLQLLPLTPLIAALRQVMLEGAGVTDLTTELALILIWTVISFGLALKWFRWN